MIIMRKRITLILAVLIILQMFVSCGKNATLTGDSIPIPENGIISADVMRELKDEGSVAVFTGTSGDFYYEWTVFGSDIDTPADAALALELASGADGEITAKLADGSRPAAVLSVTLPERSDISGAEVRADGKTICSASVTGVKTTILNFSVPQTLTEFTIVTDKAEESTAPQTTAGTATAPNQTESSAAPSGGDYLSRPQQSSDGRIYSDGKATETDKYKTDPVPEGRPMPVEPEDATVDTRKSYTCTISIECSTILNNIASLDPAKLEVLPTNGILLDKMSAVFYEGESVYDVLSRVCREAGIHMESSWTPMYNSAYIEGIGNLYEFDCGTLSGWMYRVNGWYPNYGCSRYALADGDVIEWRYTCDLGRDVGCDLMAGE